MADPTLSGLKAFCQANLQPGMTVIDVGANTGEITALASEIVTPSGRVIAYEPSPVAALALLARFRHHRQIEVRECALSDHTGRESFYIDTAKSTASTLYAGVTGPGCRIVNVAVRTLDDELPSLPAVDMIKVDAQGAEARIFEAARRLLKQHKPLLVLEVWPHGLRAAGTDANVLLDRLAGLGYHFHPLNAKGRLGHPGKIRELIAGETRSKVMNVVAHPRRWPARRWRGTLTEAPCVIPRQQRALCRLWTDDTRPMTTLTSDA
jgi:FkbM family methyltransferase